jgi:tetratricopeptide (TPR) repeat protein
MQQQERSRGSFASSTLPWIIGAVALVVYLVTLNHWVTMASLPVTAKVTGWDWYPPLQAPLHYVLTFPVRLLPTAWQPVALNMFAAVCAALTLGLLARSVARLPHDRTREQRQREHSEFSLLSIRAAWLPPVLAALVCGLQLSFWEHATADTGEALDLLLVAFVIWSLLEYRIDGKEQRLARLALVYALGMTNNWAMVGFFPFFLVALVWIKGWAFFDMRFLGRMAGMGLLGLSLYLLLPLVSVLSGASTAGFWLLLKMELASQVTILRYFPKYVLLLVGLTSLLPLFIISIRWPSSFGDTSIIGAALSNVMFRVVHAMFFVACLWVAFDPRFSPRSLGQGLPLLPAYYLGALCIGYLSGYFLLVFGRPTAKAWQRPSPVLRLLGPAAVALVWAVLAGVPTALIYRNWPSIRTARSPLLADFAALVTQALPTRGTALVSDESQSLLLLEASLRRQGQNHPHLMIDTSWLPYHTHQRQLQHRYGTRVPNLLADGDAPDPLDTARLTLFLVELARSNTVFYVNPSFGYYFESIYQQPRGLLYEVAEFKTDDVEPPPLTAAQIAANHAFWAQAQPLLERLVPAVQRKNPDALFVGRAFSRALNSWGVALQRLGQFDEAAGLFQQAQAVNPDNFIAGINLSFNEGRRRGQVKPIQLDRATEAKLGGYGSWDPILMAHGSIDEPGLCLRLGQEYANNSLYRQAAQQFARVQALAPDNLPARLLLAEMYVEGQVPDKALEAIRQLRSPPTAQLLSVTNQLQLTRLEALAHFSKSQILARNFRDAVGAKQELQKAEAVLVAAQKQYPQQDIWLETLAQIYWLSDELPKALATRDQQLQLAPGNVGVLLNKTAIYLKARDYAQAQAQLDHTLKVAPNHLGALLLQLNLHMENKAYDKAAAVVDKVLELDANNTQALLNRAAIAIETKAYAQAFEPLNRILKGQPSHSAALMNRAIANLLSDRLNDAQRDYEKLRQLVPKLHAVYYGLGEIAYRRKRTAEAIAHYEAYLKYAPAGLEEAKSVTERLNQLKAGAQSR